MSKEDIERQRAKDPYLLRCEYCKHRGPTTTTYTGDGPKHLCWCHLDGIPGPLHDLYSLGCERWELASRFNHEEDAE